MNGQVCRASSLINLARRSREQADRLVADLVQSLAALFSEIPEQDWKAEWTDRDNVSTEETYASR